MKDIPFGLGPGLDVRAVLKNGSVHLLGVQRNREVCHDATRQELRRQVAVLRS